MLRERRTITRWSMLVFAAVVMLGALPAQADPPVFPPTIKIPAVFCFRLTDIRRVPGDPEGDRFQFEFEVLNWSSTEAFDLRFALNTGTGFGGFQNSRPFLAGASVDANGRPLGAGDDN